MEYDGQKAARVWQRVQESQPDTAKMEHWSDLPMLITEQMQLMGAYLQLSRHGGREGTQLMRLAREAKMQANCLKGISRLIHGQIPAGNGVPVQVSQGEGLLRWCYGQELRLLKTYESRSADVEYGPVFARMAARGREHCCTVSELAGILGK